MPFLLLILPILAHILLAAHLLFHGLGLFVSVLPLLAVPLLFIPKRWMVSHEKSPQPATMAPARIQGSPHAMR